MGGKHTGRAVIRRLKDDLKYRQMVVRSLGELIWNRTIPPDHKDVARAVEEWHAATERLRAALRYRSIPVERRTIADINGRRP